MPGARAGEEEQRGRRLKVIETEPLGAILDLALSRVLRRRLRKFNMKAVEAVQADLRREFHGLLQQNSRRVRGMTRSAFLQELERSRHEILLRRDEAQRQLDELMEKVGFFDDFRDLDERVLAEGARRFEEEHRPDLERRIVRLLDRADRAELDRDALRSELVGLAARSVAEDRRRIQAARVAEYDQVVGRFERRIAKLSHALAESERALAELARQRESPGLPSGYREVQGLDPEADQRRLKEILLEKLYRANLLLQGRSA